MSDLTYRDRVAHYFKAHPGVWIDGMELATVGGCYASRSRIADCRTQLGMVIENRVRRMPNSQRRVSEYRFVPPSQPVQAALFQEQVNAHGN